MQIGAIENCVWYRPSVNHAKLVQPNSLGNGGLGAGVSGAGGLSGSKWCGDCNSKTHNPDACWGICPHCDRRGHRQEFCKKEIERALAAKALTKAEKNKEKRERRKQRKKEEGAAAKTAAQFQSALTPNLISSSGSEMDSPIMLDARATRVNQVVANRILFNFDEQQLLKRHEEMENSIDMGQVKLAVERMGAAKRASPSPAMQGNCSKNRG